MSYCRLTPDSDVYVYRSSAGYVCHDCTLSGRKFIIEATGEVILTTPAEMIAHLELHREAGDRVPQYAMDELEGECDDSLQMEVLETQENS